MNSPKPQSDWIDGSLYPDEPVPEKIETLAAKVDFLIRMCAAWDFGLPPSSDSLKEALKDDWKQAVDEAQFLTSCSYHLLRELHHLEPVRYSGPSFPDILNDPFLDSV